MKYLGAIVLGAAIFCRLGATPGASGAELNVGDIAPNFTLPEFGTGQPVNLYDFDGSIVVLDFFAYWCPHCEAAAAELEPQIDAYYRDLGGNSDGIPVRLVAASVDSANTAGVEDFVERHGLEVVLDDDDGDVFLDYSDRGSIPHLVIVNGASGTNEDQWEILHSQAGFAEGQYALFRSIIDDVQVVPQLTAGDANQDLRFDQLDLFRVLRANKYLTSQLATWGQGDWNGAPGGSPGAPPEGDGVFDTLDVIAAHRAGTWLAGPYAAEDSGLGRPDAATAVGYDAATGEVWIESAGATPLTSVRLESAAGIFRHDPAQNLGGAFDVDTDHLIFKSVFGAGFGTLSFGHVAEPGLSEAFLGDDLDVMGSTLGGGGLANVDLRYVPVPEPAAFLMAWVGLMATLVVAWARPPRH